MKNNQPRRRYLLFFFIMLLSLVNYIDRGAMSYASTGIMEEFHLNRIEWGFILGYFGYGYILGALCGGFVVDKTGPRHVWIIAGSAWSVFAMATAYAGNLGVAVMGGSAMIGFATIRILFGFAEAPAFSANNKAVSTWAIPKERGFVVGVTLLQTPLGAMLTAPLAVGLQSVTGSWRSMFFALGFLSLCVLFVLTRIFTDRPGDNKFVTLEEKSLLSESHRAHNEQLAASFSHASQNIPWHHFFKSRTLVANAVAYFSFIYVTFLLLTWTPKYLQDQFHVNLASLSYVGMIPWVGACFTVVLGGKVSDKILNATGSLFKARALFAAACLLTTSVCFYLVSQSSNIWTAIGILTVANAMNSLPNAMFWTIVIDSAPAPRVGTFSGITHAIANTGAVIAPTLTGYLTSKYGYSAMFSAAAIATGVGVVAMLMVRPGHAAAAQTKLAHS